MVYCYSSIDQDSIFSKYTHIWLLVQFLTQAPKLGGIS